MAFSGTGGTRGGAVRQMTAVFGGEVGGAPVGSSGPEHELGDLPGVAAHTPPWPETNGGTRILSLFARRQ